MLRGASFIASADLATMMRQRETLLWVFLMPIVFFYFIGTVTGGYGQRPSADRPDTLVLEAPADAGPIAAEIVTKLGAQNFKVETPAAGTGGAQATRVLVIPAPASGKTFSDAVLAGERQSLTYRTKTEGSAAELERLRVTRAVYGVVADLGVMASEGQAATPEAFRALEAAPRHATLSVESAGSRTRIPTGFEQTVPGTMVMFTMLVTLTSGGVLLVVERRLGLLRRLASAPIPRASVVAGKWAARFALAVVQIAFAMITGSLLFGMHWGAALPAVLVLLATWAAFNSSLALLLGSLARTEGQMVGIGVISSMVLGALGGCWWPIEITPRWMQSLSLLLPTGWTMNAMHHLVSFGDPAVTVVPHVGAIAVGAVVLGWAAVKAFRYE